MNYWLMKSEPDEFSIEDLKRVKKEHWNGVRNYQARNFMRDQMKKGDRILFYHSSCRPPGVVGVAEVAREAYPDHTAQDPDSSYYDPKATPDNPRWYMVDVKYVKTLPRKVTLDELRQETELQDLKVVKKGNRLSVMKIKKKEFEKVLTMANEQA